MAKHQNPKVTSMFGCTQLLRWLQQHVAAREIVALFQSARYLNITRRRFRHRSYDQQISQKSFCDFPFTKQFVVDEYVDYFTIDGLYLLH